jgi:VanZ family protein
LFNFEFSNRPLFKFLPALLMMLAIYLFSARPSDNLPMSLLQKVFYKAGHVVGYALLSFSYWRAFKFRDKRRWLVWLLAILYAATDEYHQSFVPGRHPTAFDVLVYDNFGALVSVWLIHKLIIRKQADVRNLAVES